MSASGQFRGRLRAVSRGRRQLEELVDGASGDTPAATLLRKVKVVAARAGVPELGEWVERELNGYPEGVELPEYRGPFAVEAHGNFMGFMNHRPDELIPSFPFPDEMKDLFKVSFRQPIAGMEDLLSKNNGEVLGIPWSANHVGLTNTMMNAGRLRLYEGVDLVSAWRVVPRGLLIAIIDKVRNRILDLALELEKTAPKTGQVDAPPLTADTKQTIVTNIYGGNQNLAMASANVTQTVNINPGDWGALEKRLTELGVSESDIEQLHEAIKRDGGAVDGEIGQETSRWLVRVMPRIESLGIGATGSMLANLIGQFLGIG
jgi:hypothetical protein